ncbi:MAG: hypothetical protein ACR2NP_16270, partial [Pirellulaceae bacterium]
MLMRMIVIVALLAGCGIADGQELKLTAAMTGPIFGEPDARKHLNTLLSLTTDIDGRLVLAREVWDQHGLSKERRFEQKLERYKEQWDESKSIGPNFRSEIENGYYDSLTDVFDRLDAVFPLGGR